MNNKLHPTLIVLSYPYSKKVFINGNVFMMIHWLAKLIPRKNNNREASLQFQPPLWGLIWCSQNQLSWHSTLQYMGYWSSYTAITWIFTILIHKINYPWSLSKAWRSPSQQKIIWNELNQTLNNQKVNALKN